MENLVELKKEELVSLNGGDCGIVTGILAGLAIAAGAEIFGDWDNFKAGLTGKPPVDNS